MRARIGFEVSNARFALLFAHDADGGESVPDVWPAAPVLAVRAIALCPSRRIKHHALLVAYVLAPMKWSET